MAIINKGILNSKDAYAKLVGNDWPTAQVLYTQDILETSGNLYFTNIRAITSVFPAVTQLVVTTPVFNYNLDQYSGDNPEIYVTAGETISFELAQSPSHPFEIRLSNGGSAYNTGLTHVDTDGTISSGSAAQGKYTGKLFWKIPYELAGSTYVYQCTNHSSMVGNIVIQGSILGTVTPLLTTANVVEKDNLYFTNQRVFDVLSYADLSLNNLILAGDLEVQGNVVTLNTGVLTVEDKNITLANGAVNAAAADGAGINIAGADANILYRSSDDRFVVNKTLEITANLVANGLIIRNIDVSDTVLAGNVTGTAVTGANILADSVTSNIWNRLYTANVIETTGNLYFTVQRARDSFTAGENITITNGEISAQTGQTVVINESTTVTATAATLTYSMGRSVTDAKNILVIIEGMIQIPVTDYSVSGSSLILTEQPPVGTNIEIRFFGTESSNASAPSLLATVNTFNGNGSNTDFILTVSPPGKSYVTVVIDGVTQLADAYEVQGKKIILSEPPVLGANVDVRILTGVGTNAFNTRTFTGDGANTSFTITSGFTENTILVFENGVAQVPVLDYTLTDTTLEFTSAPAANVVIQVRELGVVPNVAPAPTITQVDTSTNFNVFSFLLGGM